MLHVEHRMCLTEGCGRLARRRGRTCQRCATRAWRDRNRAELRARERERTFTPEQQKKRAARATIAKAVERGKIPRGRCMDCGDPEASPLILDPAQPLAAKWYCRPHYAERSEEPAMSAEARAKTIEMIAGLRERVAALSEGPRGELARHLTDIFGDRDRSNRFIQLAMWRVVMTWMDGAS